LGGPTARMVQDLFLASSKRAKRIERLDTIASRDLSPRPLEIPNSRPRVAAEEWRLKPAFPIVGSQGQRGRCFLRRFGHALIRQCGAPATFSINASRTDGLRLAAQVAHDLVEVVQVDSLRVATTGVLMLGFSLWTAERELATA
jgi:hypothetical protein